MFGDGGIKRRARGIPITSAWRGILQTVDSFSSNFWQERTASVARGNICIRHSRGHPSRSKYMTAVHSACVFNSAETSYRSRYAQRPQNLWKTGTVRRDSRRGGVLGGEGPGVLPPGNLWKYSCKSVQFGAFWGHQVIQCGKENRRFPSHF